MDPGVRAAVGRRVALVPWGTPLEVFLDPLDRTLDDFCERLSGGWLFGYAEALAAAGYAPRIVVSSRTARTRHTRTHGPTGTPVTVLPAPREPGARPPGLRRDLLAYRHALAPGLLRELSRGDVVLVQEYEEPRADLLAWCSRLRRIPVVASFQGGIPPWERAPVQRRVRAASLRQLAGLLVGSHAEADRLVADRGLDPRRVFRVANAVDTDAWSPQDRPAARRRLGLPDRAFVVAWYGRVDLTRKGLDVLVAAWGLFCSHRPDLDVRLLLVGGGPDEAALRSLLGQAGLRGVDWLAGYAPAAVVRERLAACDLWVSASRHEGFAVAPLEAMASGRAVLLTDAPGAAEVAAPAGALVPRGDAVALAQGLLEQSRLPGAALDAAGTINRRRAAEHFSVPAVGRQLAVALTAVGVSPTGRRPAPPLRG